MRIEDVSILVCDDSILARKQLKDVISTLGTPTFYEAADGVDAVKKYKEFKPETIKRKSGHYPDGQIFRREIIEYVHTVFRKLSAF